MSNSAKKSPPNLSKTAQSASTATSERKPALSIIKDIQRQTRRQYSAEEKIGTGHPAHCAGRLARRTVSSRDLSTRRPQPRRRTAPTFIIGGSDCRSSKEFLEAGKKRLAGDTTREATAPEVQSIKSENEALKQLVAELSRFGGPTRK